MSISKPVSEACYGERNTVIGPAWTLTYLLVWPEVVANYRNGHTFTTPYFIVSPPGAEVCFLTPELGLALAFILG